MNELIKKSEIHDLIAEDKLEQAIDLLRRVKMLFPDPEELSSEKLIMWEEIDEFLSRGVSSEFDLEIKNVTYSHLQSGPYGSFSNRKLEMTAEVQEGQDWRDVELALRDTVKRRLSLPTDDQNTEKVREAVSSLYGALSDFEDSLKPKTGFDDRDIPF